ncbi:MAG: hypothetical protein WC682_01410 [Parcubacteria group bacterium]|jgi:hypothetical protein
MKILRKIAQAWRLILFIIGVIILVAGLLWGIFWGVNKLFFHGKLGNNGEIKTYQVLVSIHDNTMPDPAEDKKTSIKKGYALGLYPEDHQWSDTEKVSFLILKMKLNETEATDLMAPVEKDINIKTLPKEEQDRLKKEKDAPPQKETLAARKYKINLEKINFSDPNSLLKGQPFTDKVFGWEIVEKIK